ncbi:Ig-like domain-containing protein [Cupriavidus pampae]|uniref:Bacterial Ig-like domain-containing protein n=1 Tax=Cupriavidus pampae TaxID=659251 RepID=A0ABN7Y921_9BURK|nr:Ig-like domain-containing protein [Cupriavidus pampae]CAG9169878.1 hypothetical protein LMG32289_01894 [Cupriavidus pampae]
MASILAEVPVRPTGQPTIDSLSRLRGKAPRRLKAVPGAKYVIQQEGGNVAPENITLRRQGDDLQVIPEGASDPVLVIEGAFSVSEPIGLYGVAEDGQLYSFVPTDGSQSIQALRDGALMPAALGESPVGVGVPPAAVPGVGETPVTGLLASLAGMGAIFGVAVATSSNGSNAAASGGDGGQTSNQPFGASATDGTGLIRGQLKEGAYTDDRRPIISGSGTPGYVITVYDNGVPIGTTTVGQDGTWSFQPTEPLADGPHRIEVTQQGPGMAPSPPMLVTDLNVDGTPPAAPTVLVDGNTGPATNNAHPAISGTGEPGNTVRVIFPNGEERTTVVNPDGTWSVTPPDGALPEGEQKVRVIAEDNAGNLTEVTVPLVIDTVPPVVQIGTVTDHVAPVVGPVANGGATNDTMPTFTGTAEPGITITIADNGVTIGSAVADATGAWGFTPAQPLSEGNHAVTVTGKDAAGNTSAAAQFALTVDTIVPPKPAANVGLSDIVDDVGPIRGPIAPDGATDDARPTFGGVGTPGNVITVYDNGVAIGTAVIAASRHWTMTPGADLAGDQHSITVTETDAAGNESPPSDPVRFTLDVTLPDASKLAITSLTDDVGAVTGNVASGASSDDSRPVIAGTGTADDTIIVFTEDITGRREIGRTTVGAQGTWTLEPALPLIAGSNSLTVVEQDAVGNQTAPSAPYVFLLQTAQPELPTIVNIRDDVGGKTGMLQMGELTDDTLPTIVGTALAGSTVTVSDGTTTLGTTTADASGNWTFTPSTPLAEGTHSVTATATSGGVTSAPTGARTFTVDTAAPAAVSNLVVRDDEGAQRGVLADGDTTDDSRPAFSGRAEAGSTVAVLDNGVRLGETRADAGGNWTFTPALALPDGGHAFTTVVTNAAGVAGAASPPFNVTIDTSTVPVQIVSLTDDVGNVTGAIAPGSATDDTRPEIRGVAQAGSTISVLDGPTTLGTTTTDATGRWTFIPPGELGQGQHSLTAVARDAAGNTSAPTPAFVFRIDTAPPAVPPAPSVQDEVGPIRGRISDGGVTDSPQPTLSGTGEAGGTIGVYDNDKLIGTTTADATGKWTYTPTTPLPEGQHAFTITTTDAAGNTSGKSAPTSLTIDVTPPDASRLALTGVADNAGAITGNVAAGQTTDDDRPSISGTGTAGDRVVVSTTDSNGSHVVGQTTVSVGGLWTVQLAQPLVNGNNALTVLEIDAAGNQTAPTAPYSIVVDTSRPPAPTIVSVQDNVGTTIGLLQPNAVTDDSTPTFSGTAQPGTTVRLYDGTTLLGSAVADASGAWSFTPSVSLTGTLAAASLADVGVMAVMTEGLHNVGATATTAIGQTSDLGTVWTFTVDTVPPAAVNDLVVRDDEGGQTGPLADGAVTDDSRPTFSGTAEAGSTVEVFDNGVSLGTTTVAATRAWMFEPAAALQDGAHAFTTVVTDVAGNRGAASQALNVTLDTAVVPLQITAIADDAGNVMGNIASAGVTDDTRPEIQGEAKAGSTITVRDGATVLGTAIADASSRWTFTPTSDLGQGQHSITATARDPAGNTSPPTPAFTFRVDTVAPASTTILGITDDVGIHQGAIASGGMTDDAQPALSGRAEAGSTVTIYDNDAVIGTVVASATGSWTFTPTTPLIDGDHQFEATATDAAGNESGKSSPFSMTLDTAAPNPAALAITGMADDVGSVTGNVAAGATTDDSRPDISGTGTAGDTVIVSTTDSAGTRELGRVTVSGAGTWTLTPASPLLSGTNVITAVEMDRAGNQTPATAPYAIVVDTARPGVPIISNVQDDAGPLTGLLQKGGVTDDNLPTILGTARAGDTIRVFDGATLLGTASADTSGNWSFTPATALADGLHNVTVTATNVVGQTSVPTGNWNFSIDTTVPGAATNLTVVDDEGTQTGVLANNATTDDSRPTFSGRAEAGSTVEISDNNVQIGEAIVDSGGSWSFSPASPLADGSHTFTTVVRDLAGNASLATAPLRVTVDTTAVVVQIGVVNDDIGAVRGTLAPNAVTDDTRPEFQGTGKSGSTITVFDGSTSLGTTTVDGSGKWTFTPSGELGQGSHSITATARDLAGNVSAPTPAFAFTIDTSAPLASSITGVTDDVGAVKGAVASGGLTDDPLPTLAGTAEARSTITIYDNGKVLGTEQADASGNWSFTPTTALPAGQHVFEVTATDAAGNVSPKSGTFTIGTDYTVPDASKLAITGVVDDVGAVRGNVAKGATSDDSSPLIQGTGTAGNTIIVSVTDSTGTREIGRTLVAAGGTWSMEPLAPLLSGGNAITAVEMTPAGNQSAPTPSYTIVLDFSRPPAPTIENVEDDVERQTGMLQKGGQTNDAMPTIIGTADADSKITLYDGATQLGETRADASGNWTFTPALPMADGSHNITVTATNAIGQSSNPTGGWNFVIDSTAPFAPASIVVRDNAGAQTGALSDGAITDDSRPVFSGRVEVGGKVEISDGGVKIGEATADGNGNWSFTPATSLADGSHSFTMVAIDAAGNASVATTPFRITLDTTAVVVSVDSVKDDFGSIQGAISASAVTDDTRPQFEGKGKSGSTITVSDGASVLGTTTVDGTGHWVFTPPGSLGQGSHSVTVTARDLSGNTSAPTPPFVFTVDTVAPAPPSITKIVDDVGAKQGDVQTGTPTDDSQPTLSGTAEAGSLVTLYDNDAKVGTVTADSSGNWSFTPTSPLSEGNHAMTLTATDVAGNTSSKSAALTITTDYTPPDITKLAITGVLDDVGAVTGNVVKNGTTDDANPAVQGTATAGNTVIVSTTDATGTREIGRATVASNGTWSVTPAAALLAGQNKLTAVEMDVSGNQTAPSAEYVITLDLTRPAPPVITGITDDVGVTTGTIAKGSVTDDRRPLVIGTAVAASMVAVYAGAEQLGLATVDANGAWSLAVARDLAEGTHDITAKSVNAVGQVSDASGAWRIIVDTTPPDSGRLAVTSMFDDVGAVTGNVAKDGATDDARPSIRGTGTAGDTIVVSTTDLSGKVELGRTTVAADGSWSFTPATDLRSGSNAITAVEQDAAGNETNPSAAYTITVVTAKPSIVIKEIRDDVGIYTAPVQNNGATDDTMPTIAGTTEAGSLVSVFDGANLLGTTTADSGGNWTFTPSSALAEGPHSFSANARNPLGVTSDTTAAWTITVDTTPPAATAATTVDLTTDSDTGAANNDNITNDSTPTFQGVVTAPGEILNKLTVTLFADVNGNGVLDAGDRTLAQKIAVAADGKWEITLPSMKPDTYALRALLVDESGNVKTTVSGSLLGPTGTPQSPLVIESGGRVSVSGGAAGDQVGWDMTDVGDFNGDGISDLLLSAPFADTNKADSGICYILYGSTGGLPEISTLTSLSAAKGLVIRGHTYPAKGASDTMGLVLNKIGDFNRDGYADVAFASHTNDKVYVIFGAPSGSFTNGVLQLSTIDGGDSGTGPFDNSHGFAVMIGPITADSGFGFGVAGADINGDGYVDLLASDPLPGRTASSNEGQALVFYGGKNMNATTTGWQNISVQRPAGQSWGILTPRENVKYTAVVGGDTSSQKDGVKNVDIGNTMSAIGDVNGDGIDDFLLIDASVFARTQINPLTTNGATAYVVFGKAGGLAQQVDLTTFKNGTDGLRIHSMFDDRLGTPWGNDCHVVSSGIGDVNGDGIDDFAIGSPYNLSRVWVVYGKLGGFGTTDMYLDAAPPPGRDYFPRDPNHVQRFSAADGFVILNAQSSTQSIANSAERFGLSVRGGGDLNADGIADFVIGAPFTNGPAGTQTGAVYVVYGTGSNLASPIVAIKDVIADPSKGYVIYGNKAGEQLGTSVAVGDWNGDGLMDIAAGSPGADQNGNDSGAFYVYYSAVDFSQPYTSGDDVLTANLNGGAAGFDRLFGGGGDDTFNGVGASDYANGGAGNDIIKVTALSFKAIDGGMGKDTLVLDAQNLNLDLNVMKSKLTGIEKIDLSARGNNTLSLGYGDVQRLGDMNMLIDDGKTQFAVLGDNTDKVVLRNPAGLFWSDAGRQTVEGVSYRIYTVGTGEIFLDDRLNVSIV